MHNLFPVEVPLLRDNPMIERINLISAKSPPNKKNPKSSLTTIIKITCGMKLKIIEIIPRTLEALVNLVAVEFALWESSCSCPKTKPSF